MIPVAPHALPDYLNMRTALVGEGRTRDPIEVLPSDLERFRLPPWPGRLLGMECVPSPIVLPKQEKP